MLTVPIMLFMGIPGPVANGTNRVAILAQNISATTAFFQHGFRGLRLGLSLAAAAVPGAILGALAGVQLQGVWFDRVLALVMIFTMILMARNSSTKESKKAEAEVHEPSAKQLWRGHLCMLGVGLWGGFIQIGVGFILMPVLHRVLGFDLVRVNFLKVFIVLCYTVVALAVYAWQLELAWLAGIALALGNAIGGWFGAKTSIGKGESWIRWVLNAALLAIIVKLLFF